MLVDREYINRILGYKETDQERLILLLEWVQSKAESLIGRKLDLDTYTWYLDGNYGDKIVLPVRPVVSITALYLDSGHDFETETDSDDYYVDLESGIIQLYGTIAPKRHRTIKVIASAGYDEDTFPADMKMAFLEAISWNMSRMLDRSFGRTNQSTPDGMTVGYEMVLPMGVQRVFESYRDVRV
jgi:hypothetical protein